MNGIREFRLYGRSDLECIRTKIEVGVKTWSARWFKDLDAPGLSSLKTVYEGNGASAECRRLPTSGGAAYWVSPPDSASRLLRRWLSGKSDQHSSVVDDDEEWCDGFVSDLLRDLLVTIAGGQRPSGDSNSPLSAAETMPVEMLAQNSGALFVVLEFGLESVTLALSPALVKHLLKDFATVQQPISRCTSAADALLSAPVTLKVGAWMDESLSIQALHDLAVGDVLLLGRKIDVPWSVIAPDGATVAQGYLGQQNRQQAIKLVSAGWEPQRYVE